MLLLMFSFVYFLKLKIQILTDVELNNKEIFEPHMLADKLATDKIKRAQIAIMIYFFFNEITLINGT